ncbi:hypothetical protein SAMN05444392_104223 [Seinonella peptonophila]|uniref:DUF4025 domain-containing protein n=1 Tax=Seinonella peptonophila TaxID=112248 RepID=A0A1M4XAH7_9BACL|nr:hypothetical protein [Seinonella peptonophila]SHE90396.1 hypothetical protein SAMN05444392_104223 [Seinonella peptonophila]
MEDHKNTHPPENETQPQQGIDQEEVKNSPLDQETENRISESISEGMVQGDIDGF